MQLTYDNIKAKTGQFTSQYGITPSTGVLMFAPDIPIEGLPVNGQLVFDDGNTKAELEVWLDSTVFDQRTGNIQALVKDIRWMWKFPAAFGRFNQPSGEFAKPSQDKNAKELAIILMDQMNRVSEMASYNEVDIDLPEDAYPPVDWKWINAAQALDELCSLYGRRISLGFDRYVRIQKTTTDATPEIANTNALENGVVQYKDIELPESIMIVGGRKVVDRVSQYSAVAELIPVAEDDDGDIKALSDIAYLTGGDGLVAQLRTQFSGLSSERQARAKPQVARWYQIPEAQQEPAEAYKYLPMLKIRARRIQVAGEWRHDEPTVEVDIAQWNMGEAGEYVTSVGIEEVKGGYSLDYERGIVKFSRPMFGDDSPTPCANVRIIYAHEVFDNDGTDDYLDDWYTYEKVIDDPRAVAPTRMIHKPEFVQYEDSITTPGAPWSNKDELDLLAEQYIDEIVESLINAADPKQITISGVVNQFAVAGIDSVTFDFSESGPKTTITVQLDGYIKSVLEGKTTAATKISRLGDSS